MERPSEKKDIHAKSFNKVHEALNKVHNVKWTDSNLHVPAVLWAYRTACKNLTAQAPPRLEYKANVISPIVYENLRPHMIALVDTMACRTLKEESQQGNSRLQELEEGRV